MSGEKRDRESVDRERYGEPRATATIVGVLHGSGARAGVRAGARRAYDYGGMI